MQNQRRTFLCKRCGASIDIRKKNEDGSFQCPECRTIYRPRSIQNYTHQPQMKVPKRQSKRIMKRWNQKKIFGFAAALLVFFILIGTSGNINEDKINNSFSKDFVEASQQESEFHAASKSLTALLTQQPTQASTQSPTQAPTEYITKSPTPQPTVFVTQAPTAIDIAIQKISPGDSGETVKKLQQRLKTLGFLSDSADGIYGTNTTAAVKAYQKAAGLEVTGICDYTTYLSMTSSDAPRIKKTETSSSNKKAYSYIGNSATKKFHRSSCSEIKKMNDSNKVSISSRDKAINNGYVPCKKCNP